MKWADVVNILQLHWLWRALVTAWNALVTAGQPLVAATDKLSEKLMNDTVGYIYGQTQPEHSAAGKSCHTVKHEFRGKFQCTTIIRRIWLVVALLGMIAWLVVDVNWTELDGLVPGLRDAYVISAAPINGKMAKNETFQLCSCTFRPDIGKGADSAKFAFQPPYSKIVARNTSDIPGARQFLKYCNRSILPGDTPERKYLAALIHELYYNLYTLRLTAPATPIKLDPETWKAARFFQAQGYAAQALTLVQAKIWTAQALPHYNFTDNDIDAISKLADVLHVSFFQQLAKLDGIPDNVVTAEEVSANGTKTPVNCTGILPSDQSKIIIQDWCRHNASEVYDLDENCPDPYAAYEQWCAPVFCSDIQAKKPYLLAMQILAAIGGMYSIITLFAFTLMWTIVRLAERLLHKIYQHGTAAMQQWVMDGITAVIRQQHSATVVLAAMPTKGLAV